MTERQVVLVIQDHLVTWVLSDGRSGGEPTTKPWHVAHGLEVAFRLAGWDVEAIDDTSCGLGRKVS